MHSLRRKYFVNTRLQLTLMVGANVLALISSTLLVTIAFLAKAHVENYATGLDLPLGHPALQFIAERERAFDRLCFVVGIVQFLLFNLTALVLSHRIAGPLFRLERHLDAIGAGGEPADVHFRKGDLYQDLAEASNKVLARLRDATATR